MKASQAWQAVLGQLQVDMPKSTYDTWVRDAELVAYEDGSFVVGVNNAYACDWLESRLKSTVTRLLTGMMNRTVEVRFVVWQPAEPPEDLADMPSASELALAEIAEPQELAASSGSGNFTFNPRYTFDTFVVGQSNRLAHAASLAVAENPARAYNPLFLYGRVGLGKTHLLRAIGNAALQKGLQVLYVSSEEFTNDLIHAIRSHSTQAFRDKYRRTDVLLIDDIQFIAGKESTQEEFFHTFNTLHGQNKQIVITSDRSPKGMMTLEERLRSRFEWGLIADIQPPDIETRVAILEKKAEVEGVDLPQDVALFLATNIDSNVRELEGSLTRLGAFASLNKCPITVDFARDVLQSVLRERSERAITIESIQKAVCDFFRIRPNDLRSKRRTRTIALPRQVAMYLCRRYTNASFPVIGDRFGGRDHSTVIHAAQVIERRLREDPTFRATVERLERLLERPG